MADEKPDLDCGRVISLDTPTRKQVTSPVSKFEDSPVFNYINNLSPIQPVKPVHATQTFNSLSFTALPSVFTSPHISSLKESRFLRRHQSDPSNPEFSSEIENKVHTERNENSSDHQQMLDLANYVVQSKEYLKHPAKECSEKLAVAIRMINEDVGAEECDWENLLYGDVLGVESPNHAGPLMGHKEEMVGPSMSYCRSVVKTQPVGAVDSNEICDIENLSTQPGESGDLRDVVDNQDQDIFACISLEGIAADPTKEMDDELVANLDRGKRRRCLVFEKVVSRRKNFNDDSTSRAKIPSNNDKLTINNTSSARRILSGFGLHLNSLALTSKDQNVIKHETSGTGGLIISVAGHSLSSGRQPLTDSTEVPNSMETESGSIQNQLMLLEDSSQYSINEEPTQSSPRKKKRRSDNGGDETCKRCNCKKSRCLKLYCECFAAGVYCSEPCSCHDCFNKPINEEIVLSTRKQIESRNPLAFAPKVIRTSDSGLETVHEVIKKTPASARHKRGCNCKKSGCLKKYCECYQGGVGCSINCRCEGCKNAYGKKNGNHVLFGATEPELEEMYNGERSIGDRALPKNMINETDHIPIALTPRQFHRPSEQTFSLKSKPPRSGPSAGTLYGTQRFGRQSMVQAQAKFDEPFCTVQSDDMPEILHQNRSPVTGVKSLSPNSKRVSSPHCDSSPGQRSSRKSLLRSIPSFPSLTDPKH